MTTQAMTKRVGLLEASYGGSEACPECGDPPDGKRGPNDTYELIFVDPEEDSENEWCQTCGRPIRITLTWGDGA